MKDLLRSALLAASLIVALLVAKNVQGNTKKGYEPVTKEKIENTTKEDQVG
ncbi:hypothetical protein [Allomuricauda sp. SCSIO 65647]|uniref:hypothetical protein n=1 Tax=Allomuricauda sp. SCSIO 65647 TaxID=2908843 RepID=UPI001F2A851E|nr:hypothetical protein [Muricauda sp. SCSIO 65647]UJH66148.1 hypothetical protein L0P89_09195 [Muricauda sp. SCSIO 65647]